jgi:hypothetical protein
MALINLLTNLNSFYQDNPFHKEYKGSDSSTPPDAIARGSFDQKSFKFGHDRRGGGSSNQPYITTPIPEKLGEFGYLNQDFILRGGSRALTDSASDVVRLGKYFTDIRNPSGLLFVVKQNLLSRMAVRTQASTGLLNEGIYTPLSTLAEAGGIAFGLHVNKQGLNPFSGLLSPGTSTPNLYADQILLSTSNDPSWKSFNRLNVLYKNKVANDPTLINSIRGIDINSSNINILSYQGGPGSILGIGKTRIRFADQRTQYNGKKDNLLAKNGNEVLTYTNNQLSDISLSPPIPEPLNFVLQNSQNPTGPIQQSTANGRSYLIKNNATTIVGDFRALLRGRSTPIQKELGLSPLSPNYLTQNIEQRVLLGNPGDKSGKRLNNYSSGSGAKGDKHFGAASVSSYDRITAQPLYTSDAVDPKKDTNDLVQFRIQVMSNLPSNVELNTFIHFRAFLNSIDDSYEAQWDATKYLGRGESFYTYNGFNRKVSLSWTVAAQSKAELIPMYKKLNYLASTLAPDYSPTGGNMRGNMIKLTIGGYFYEQPGIITGLSYSITEDTSWEIGIGPDGQRDTTVSEVPHIIRVTGFNFIPIHEFAPRKVQQVTPSGKNDKGQTTFAAVITTQERFISLGYGPGEYDNNYNNS